MRTAEQGLRAGHIIGRFEEVEDNLTPSLEMLFCLFPLLFSSSLDSKLLLIVARYAHCSS